MSYNIVLFYSKVFYHFENKADTINLHSPELLNSSKTFHHPFQQMLPIIITPGTPSASAAWTNPVSLPMTALALLTIPKEVLKSVLPFKFNTLESSMSILSQIVSFSDPKIIIEKSVSFNKFVNTDL